MARSYLFSLGVNWKDRKQSILEIADNLWHVLYELSKIDKIFSKPVLSAENYNDVSFLIEESTQTETVGEIGSTILSFSRSDILKHERDENPTLHYSRDFGFSFVLSFFNDRNKCISFIPRLGSRQSNGFSTIYISRDFNKEFNWFFSILKTLVDECDAYQGGVNLLGTSFLEATKDFKKPLGWITYFSNSYDIPIPDDLEGIEYEYTDNGKYLILTREDITNDKETYEAHKQKLLDTMEEIKRRVPKYLK